MTRGIFWYVANRKPKKAKIVLLNVFWANRIDSGDCLDFGYWDTGREKWIRFDGNASEVEHKGNGTHPSRVVTHWAYTDELYAGHKLKNPWKVQKGKV